MKSVEKHIIKNIGLDNLATVVFNDFSIQPLAINGLDLNIRLAKMTKKRGFMLFVENSQAIPDKSHKIT
ncbi:hypothetical protein G7B40_010660 [Aetokthonos hydrillicola Thurmond2011]|jgi:hypothetical protein|uniref:Uncharacterized protein n=1 Tax=Aetokthonos hydrillicola Thurmond2011 TaxID=2712845 RepID=A0AAP5MA14_9CYAN|nr:hypothetical protein [Aetokthonos hydrillicola]MBW4585832.1 hypothetical protein [Aetokthonos hydrillicola CCALA 1050]MDR9895024.1 hypothetical protein [Aetokthonos hydrillicola Thurmond2011]